MYEAINCDWPPTTIFYLLWCCWITGAIETKSSSSIYALWLIPQLCKSLYLLCAMLYNLHSIEEGFSLKANHFCSKILKILETWRNVKMAKEKASSDLKPFTASIHSIYSICSTAWPTRLYFTESEIKKWDTHARWVREKLFCV